jgi:hypothetical protein
MAYPPWRSPNNGLVIEATGIDSLSFLEKKFNYIIKNRKEYITIHHVLDGIKFPVL